MSKVDIIKNIGITKDGKKKTYVFVNPKNNVIFSVNTFVFSGKIENIIDSNGKSYRQCKTKPDFVKFIDSQLKKWS